MLTPALKTIELGPQTVMRIHTIIHSVPQGQFTQSFTTSHRGNSHNHSQRPTGATYPHAPASKYARTHWLLFLN